MEFIKNDFFWCAFTAWISAQILKIFFHYLKEKKWDFSRIVKPGGMPSSHTAPFSALTTLIGIKIGFDTAIFVLSFFITTVIMYDAAGVRKAAGEHAKLLNIITKRLLPEEYKNLTEVLGHSSSEVAGGLILGIIIGIIFGL
jgi:acid phosphatase family membrane protein YuiD